MKGILKNAIRGEQYELFDGTTGIYLGKLNSTDSIERLFPYAFSLDRRGVSHNYFFNEDGVSCIINISSVKRKI